MYFLLLICLMFALLLISNLLISAAATALWRLISPAAERWSANRRAQIIFALRIFPFALALMFVFGIILPSYLLFEPHKSDEVVGIELAFAAAAAAAGVSAAVCRVFGTWWKTRRLVADWLKNSEAVQLEQVSIPVYRMRHAFPVIAVVGMFRPKLFFAEQVFGFLNDEEIQAAVAHEYGHLFARDNFKRTLMRVCRDLLIFPFGRRLDRAWSETAECAADEYAAGTGGDATALNLAAALVKIARVIPEGTKPALPAGSFLLTEKTNIISSRIHHLLELTESRSNLVKNNLFGLEPNFWALLIFLLSGVGLLALDRNFLERTHFFLEHLVKMLQ